MPDEPEAGTAQPGAPAPDAPYGAGGGPGVDAPILVVLLLVLAFVMITNVWLRNRAEGRETFPKLRRAARRLLGNR